MIQTLDKKKSKSQDFKKIKLKRLILDPISKNLTNHDQTGKLVENLQTLNDEIKLNVILRQSETVTSEPMVSFISQDQSTNQRFNFSENFENSEIRNQM